MPVEDRTVEIRGSTVPWRVIVPDGAGEDLSVLRVLGWSSAMDTHTPGLGYGGYLAPVATGDADVPTHVLIPGVRRSAAVTVRPRRS